MTQNELSDKIRKILKRTEEAGCTPDEAASAMKMASRLMVEHNLSLEEIQRSSDDDGMVEGEAQDVGCRMLIEHTLAGSIIKKHFFVAAFWTTRYVNDKQHKIMMLMGTQANVETAKFVYRSLISAFETTFADYRFRTRCPLSDKKGFVFGVYNGFDEKLTMERKIMEVENEVEGRVGTGIVLASVAAKAMAAYREKYPNHTTKKSGPIKTTQSSMDAGYATGRNLNLNRGVGGGTTNAITRK